MKKIFYSTLIIGLFSLGIYGCKKESPIDVTTSNLSATPSTKDGKIYFSSTQEMQNYLNHLSKLESETKIGELRNLSVLTLDVILHDIENAENENIEKTYKGLNPKLSLSEINQLAIEYVHTDIFEKYKNENLVSIEIDENNEGYSIKLFVDNPGFTSILNTNGEVLVNDTLYLFKGQSLTLINYQSNEIIETMEFGSNQKSITTGWGSMSSWLYPESDRRVKASIYGVGTTNDGYPHIGHIKSIFYIFMEGEHKRFGKWARRNSYKPCYSYNMDYEYKYSASSCWNCPAQQTPFLLNNTPKQNTKSWHSLYNFPGQVNNLTSYIEPNGSFLLPDGWYNIGGFNINYTANFSFSGGPSGIQFNLSY